MGHLKNRTEKEDWNSKSCRKKKVQYPHIVYWPCINESYLNQPPNFVGKLTLKPLDLLGILKSSLDFQNLIDSEYFILQKVSRIPYWI